MKKIPLLNNLRQSQLVIFIYKISLPILLSTAHCQPLWIFLYSMGLILSFQISLGSDSKQTISTLWNIYLYVKFLS